MNRTQVCSTHSVRISGPSLEVSSEKGEHAGWTFKHMTETMPAALWGAPPTPFSQKPAQPSAETVHDMMTGYRVTTPPSKLSTRLGPIGRKLISQEKIPSGTSPLSPLSPAVKPDATYLPSALSNVIQQIEAMADDALNDTRNAMFAVLSSSGIYSGPHGALPKMAQRAASLFTNAPMSEA